MTELFPLKKRVCSEENSWTLASLRSESSGWNPFASAFNVSYGFLSCSNLCNNNVELKEPEHVLRPIYVTRYVSIQQISSGTKVPSRLRNVTVIRYI